MSDILDDFSNEPQPVSTIFSKISFAFSFISLFVAFLTVFEYFELKTTLIPGYYVIYSPTFFLLKIGCGVGVLMTMIAYIKGEPSNIFKIVGALINFFLLGIIFFVHLIPTPTLTY